MQKEDEEIKISVDLATDLFRLIPLCTEYGVEICSDNCLSAPNAATLSAFCPAWMKSAAEHL